MKQLTLIFTCFFISTILTAQQKFEVPDVTTEQKIEILYNHVIAYAATGIGFAKTKGTTAKEYGEYIGKQFTPFWNPEGGLPVFAGGLMHILKGMHPDNEMQIIKQNEKMIQFKMKNVDFAFKNGPAFGVTYKEFLDCSYGILSILANHMNLEFSQNIVDDIWYEVKLSAK